MDHIYEKVKANSKFLKVIEAINMSGMPTTSGANPGANPGTAPVTPGTGTTAAVNPALAKTQQDMAKAQEKEKALLKQQAQAELNAIQTRTKQLQDILRAK